MMEDQQEGELMGEETCEDTLEIPLRNVAGKSLMKNRTLIISKYLSTNCLLLIIKKGK